MIYLVIMVRIIILLYVITENVSVIMETEKLPMLIIELLFRYGCCNVVLRFPLEQRLI